MSEETEADLWDDWQDPEYGHDDGDEGDGDADFDCGYSPLTGSCSLAGTEDCDFDCPWREHYEQQQTNKQNEDKP